MVLVQKCNNFVLCFDPLASAKTTAKARKRVSGEQEMSSFDYHHLGQPARPSIFSPAKKALGFLGLMVAGTLGAIGKPFLFSKDSNPPFYPKEGVEHVLVTATPGGHNSHFNLPPRVVLPELPTVYIYDHCPFCVRVRLALGLKNVKHNVVFLANDDVATPTKLVGKKIAPIFSWGKDIPPMAESLDIIAKVDSDSRFGPTGMFRPSSDRADIKAWQKSTQDMLRKFQRPRYVKAFLPEFAGQDARDTFVKNHQMPPYEKADWKGAEFSMEKRWKIYNAAFEESHSMLGQLNAKLAELDKMIYSEWFCTEGGLSLDDIDLWARLRSVTIIKGAVLPPKTRAYMDNLSKAGDILLYDVMAI
eukprot:g50428.t1